MLPDVDAVAAVMAEPIREAFSWPIDVLCRDAGEKEIVVRVKPINRKQLAGVAVSEAVTWSILSACGLHVATPYCVRMTAKFADDLSAQGGYDPKIRPGRHWGTRFLQGVGMDEGMTRQQLDQVGRPEDIFRIFVVDQLTGNADRLTEGNLMLVTDSLLPARLIAIDQSHCFGGPDCICDPECLVNTRDDRHAKHYQVMEQFLLEQGLDFVDQELVRIMAQRAAILDSVNTPHAEWYEGAGITPDRIKAYLTARLDGLANLAQRDLWRGICEQGKAQGILKV